MVSLARRVMTLSGPSSLVLLTGKQRKRVEGGRGSNVRNTWESLHSEDGAHTP